MTARLVVLAIALSSWVCSAHATDLTMSIGQSRAPQAFEYTRFAFPDLATGTAPGGAPCCDQYVSTTSTSPALKVTASSSVGAGFALDVSAAYLGTMNVAFDVSGPFGTALGRGGVTFGRCVESGRFHFGELSALAVYPVKVAGFTIRPKVGVALSLMHFRTTSRCDFDFVTGPESVQVEQHETRSSFSPVVGLEARLPLGRGVSLSLEITHTRPRVGRTQEAADYGQERLPITSAWIGLSW